MNVTSHRTGRHTAKYTTNPTGSLSIILQTFFQHFLSGIIISGITTPRQIQSISGSTPQIVTIEKEIEITSTHCTQEYLLQFRWSPSFLYLKIRKSLKGTLITYSVSESGAVLLPESVVSFSFWLPLPFHGFKLTFPLQNKKKYLLYNHLVWIFLLLM